MGAPSLGVALSTVQEGIAVVVRKRRKRVGSKAGYIFDGGGDVGGFAAAIMRVVLDEPVCLPTRHVKTAQRFSHCLLWYVNERDGPVQHIRELRYEQIGLLPPAQRMSGQRRYDATALYRPAVVQRARQLGFTLDEIRQLFFGFRNVGRASERWNELSRRKLSELDDLTSGIESVRRLLKRMMQNCRCENLEQCGKEIFRSGYVDVAVRSHPAKYR